MCVCVFFFWPKLHFLYVQVPGVILLWITSYYYWTVQHPTDQYTYLKVQEIHSFMHAACVFFQSHPRAFSAQGFVKLRPLRNSSPGSYGTHSSLFPTTVLASVVVVAKKEKVQN